MANRAGRKVLRAAAKEMGKQTALNRSFDGKDLGGIVKAGMKAGVSQRRMSKAVDKGIKAGVKLKKKQ